MDRGREWTDRTTQGVQQALNSGKDYILKELENVISPMSLRAESRILICRLRAIRPFLDSWVAELERLIKRRQVMCVLP